MKPYLQKHLRTLQNLTHEQFLKLIEAHDFENIRSLAMARIVNGDAKFGDYTPGIGKRGLSRQDYQDHFVYINEAEEELADFINYIIMHDAYATSGDTYARPLHTL